MKLKKISRIGSTLLLLFVMLMSGMNMLTATTQWLDTMWTCMWCLSLVMIVDRVDEFDTHNKG